MNEQRFSALAINQRYPFELPPGEGAISDFLRPSVNRLLVSIAGISDSEARALQKGEMRGGLLVGNGAILFVWQFWKKKKTLITLDSPFDARLISDIQLYDVNSVETRLTIDVHIVDSATKIIRGLRLITMPPGMTLEFLSAVQDQIGVGRAGDEQYKEWMAMQPHELAKQTQMWLMGK